MDELVRQMRDALESLDRPRVEAIFQQALGQQAPMQVLESLIVPALETSGVPARSHFHKST
jgi:hypothetical protein